ncbi:ubiquitin thiolesterase [Phakopsora pachyrhizi]|nr:ubiquitin thiolesterase [Phakopsora pachyrhizi]
MDPLEGPSNILPESLASPPMEPETISVDDSEAFAAKHLTNLGIPVEDFKRHSWRIPNYRKLAKRVTSDTFTAGGHEWNILLFPQGNSNGQANDMVSIYLNYGDPKKQPEGWHVCAQFALAISNPHDGTCYIQSQAQHRFTNDEQDWGFTRFVELRKLFSPADSRVKPIIENDETVITAFVRVLKDETGVLWHNFVNYDSKKETGYVGLKNQGATCYMNSLLQSLFLTNYFRKAVYQIPTENDGPDSVPLALQRVFYQLQTSDQSVGTTELTKSFGWKSLDAFLQHDVQEFSRVLQDKLESKMKGTPADGAIQYLFAGKYKTYLKCIEVDYESSREETFLDVQLDIKDLQGRPFKNLQESFEAYITPEMMDGDNKYHAGDEYGLQDAKKGTIFMEFPPVLHLHLKRFEYDFQRDMQVKINDRHEFPFEIDLAPYLDDSADKSANWKYRLHGVLVHSGDVHGGHYFVLIKPHPDSKWYKFDDDRVTPVTDREVLEDNFGGEMLINGAAVNGGGKGLGGKGVIKRFTNAYMLVYVRESAASAILAPVTQVDTPTHLKSRLEKEQREQDKKKREKEEMHLYLTTKIITDETFQAHEGFDLALFDDRTMPPSDLPTFRIPKQQPFLDFKAKVAQDLGYEPNQIRLWVLVNRQNKTVRPDTVIPEHDPTLTMEVVRDKMASKAQDLKLYLEVVDPNQELPPPDSKNGPLMVFVKYFDASGQTLAGVGHFYVDRNQMVSDIIPAINARMNFPENTPLKLYEEIKPGMIDPMKPKATFLQSEIQDGDIICFQIELSEKELADLEKQRLYLDPVAFYDFFTNRLLVQFKPRYDDMSITIEFDLLLSKKLTYDLMAARVGEKLQYDPMKLRFTNSHQGNPKSVIRRAAAQGCVADMIQSSYSNAPSNLLFYELLEMSIVEIETKRNVRVTWTGAHNRDEGQHSFLMPKTSSMHDVADKLSTMIKFSENSTNKIKLFTIHEGRVQKPFAGGEILRDVTDLEDLYAEEVQQDELIHCDEKEGKIIDVYHFQKELTRHHGIPFKFLIKPGEAFTETKERLRQRLGLTEKEIIKMKFSIAQFNTYTKPSYILDTDTIFDHKWSKGDLLGIDHLDKSRKNVGLEKAVYIK